MPKFVDDIKVKSSPTAEGTTRTVADTSGNLYQAGTQISASATELNIMSGVTATSTELNKLAGVTAGTVTASKALVVDANKKLDTLTVTTLKTDAGSATRFNKVARVALAAVDTAGGFFAWQNDEGVSIIVNRIVLDVTTKATGACTVDCGTTAVSGTTLSDNLLDGLDVGTAAGVFNNFNATDAGTNGKTIQKLAAGKWVTGSVASGASAGIVGYAYIHYTVI